ncbi:MAG: glycosyltransferase involved in cell wall biosynthesis [Phenylobacterium sp.]|jgi:glycosyltransferase involved in cell wall biosynthesis
MKILHLGKYAPPFFGGIENYMMDLSEECVHQGCEVAAIVHDHQFGGQFEQLVINGVTIFRVPTYGKLMFAPISPVFGFYLNRVIEQFKPDILHLHLPNTSAFFALGLSRAKAIPWVIHWHSDVLGDNSPWFLRLFYPAYRLFESATLNRAKKVIATSPPYLASSPALKRVAKGAEDKCQVISLGLKTDANTVSPRLTENSLPGKNRPLQLLMVGRLTFYKGHKTLIEALAQLKQTGNDNIMLNIVGDGELRGALEQQVKQSGLTHQVTLLGKISDEALQQQLRSADCLCLPSIERTEAFGVVLMEAAAVGKPAIVSDVPGSGMSWVVKAGETGLVVKTADDESLAAAIDQLYHQPQLCQRFGDAALVRFNQSFKISTVAADTISLYTQLLQDVSETVTNKTGE